MDNNFNSDAFYAGAPPFPHSSPRQRANQHSPILEPSNDFDFEGAWTAQPTPFPTDDGLDNAWAVQPEPFSTASPSDEAMENMVFDSTSSDSGYDITWASQPSAYSTARPFDIASQHNPFFDVQGDNAVINPSLLTTQPSAFHVNPIGFETGVVPPWNASDSGFGFGMETPGTDSWSTHSMGGTLMQGHQSDGEMVG